MNEQEAQLNHFFRVVGDETRLKLLGLIANQPQTADQLAKTLGKKQKSVLGHLAMLIHEKLVQREKQGSVTIYRLNGGQLDTLKREIEEGEASVPFSGSVVEQYVKNGRLTSMPPFRSAQDEVLAWLIKKFEINRRYKTAEVEAILQDHCQRPATALRYLRDRRLLLTTKGIYWRPAPQGGAG